jgi:predicted flap endonuclease-1-like 5' DNA nuclease
MSGFDCCYWWFLLGALLGWLLNWLLSKLTRKEDSVRRRSRSSSNAESRSSSSSSLPLSSHQTGISNANTDFAKSTASTVSAAPNTTAVPHRSGGADTILAALEGFKIRGNDDFEIIEGIGPKIADLFKQSGTNTFAQLAALSQTDMQKVLENGDSRFKLANPGTWALQASLCNENRWIELRTLQAALDSGANSSDSHNA